MYYPAFLQKWRPTDKKVVKEYHFIPDYSCERTLIFFFDFFLFIWQFVFPLTIAVSTQIDIVCYIYKQTDSKYSSCNTKLSLSTRIVNNGAVRREPLKKDVGGLLEHREALYRAPLEDFRSSLECSQDTP